MLSFRYLAKRLAPASESSEDTVSLGRGGSITLAFDHPIRDGLGFDFAVFENAINDSFLELGFVEVSSDGVNFFRFDNDSLTTSLVASFGEVDPTNVRNLAGKYRQGFGTPFDLEELARGESAPRYDPSFSGPHRRYCGRRQAPRTRAIVPSLIRIPRSAVRDLISMRSASFINWTAARM